MTDEGTIFFAGPVSNDAGGPFAGRVPGVRGQRPPRAAGKATVRGGQPGGRRSVLPDLQRRSGDMARAEGHWRRRVSRLRLVQDVKGGLVESGDRLGAQVVTPGPAADGGAVDVEEAGFGGPGAAAIEHQKEGFERVFHAG